MTKILGLDLGTNSIGWAIRDTENEGINQILDKGARIFSEGVKSENGKEISRAAERTAYRSARKIKYRRKLRKYETLKVLSINGMCPLSVEEVEQWKKSGFKEYPLNPEFLDWLRTNEDKNINPYLFRDKASKQKVTLFELGRALYHIAQRRGFLSNRLDQSAEGVFEEHNPQIQNLIEDLDNSNAILNELKEYYINLGIIDETEKSGFKKDLDEGEKKLKSLYNSLVAITKKNANDIETCKQELIARLNKKEDLGKVKGKIKDISQAMLDGNFKTLGQYFFSLYNKTRIRNQYTSREEHYLEEFIIICQTQGIEEINTNEKLPEKKFTGLAKDLYRAIFFQRPLKSQKGLIGKCSFEKNKSRCAVSHPDYEEFRMWSYLNTIKIGTQSEKTLRFLTLEEKLKLVPKFYRKSDFNFEVLAKELVEKGASFGYYKSSKKNEFFYWFNYKPTDSVSACVVSASLENAIGKDWKIKTFEYQTRNTEKNEVTKSVDYKDLWHLLSVATSDTYLYDFAIEKLKLEPKNAKAFSKTKLKKDFASLSLAAIAKILPYLKQGLLYSHAVFMANIENIVDADIWKDEEQQKFIQSKIVELVDNYIVEKSKLELINGLLKIYNTEDKEGRKVYYSKEAESLFEADLRKKLVPFYKANIIIEEHEQEIIFQDLFPILMDQLKKQEFIKIGRLDKQIETFLKGENEEGQIFCNHPDKLKKLYHPSDIEVFKKKIIKDEWGNEKVVLGSPLTTSIKNPMAMRALHQLRKVLNTLIANDQIDEDTRIHIEMARELNDANKRKGTQDFQNENKKFKEDAIKEIKKLYLEQCHKEVNPTEDDILRYQLWLEQGKCEIYEEGNNISICDIIGSNPSYDIEHTIPRSISQDNSQMNKTLCSQRFNRDIKKQKMPVELSNYNEILPRITHWKKEAEELTRQIETISKSIKSAATKEAKDKNIRKRHYLTLKRDYIQGKYDRFTWEEPKVGFKNSQIPDTGIITKYAQAYLKSYFKRVESVKGGAVAEFRKLWGIQESFIDENGWKHYKEKDKSKHTHHTIDAITIACMPKDKYDLLAHAWRLEDEQDKKAAKTLIEEAKPWKTFKEDIEKIETEILVSHFTPDNVKKQSKSIIKNRGKKVYVLKNELPVNFKNKIEGKDYFKLKFDSKILYKIPKKKEKQTDTFYEELPKNYLNGVEGKDYFKINTTGKTFYKIPIFNQGDTIRGSLHQETTYGAIKLPDIDIETKKTLHTDKGAFILKKDIKGNEIVFYVVRKELSKLSENDVQNIVDNVVRKKIENAIANSLITFKIVKKKKVAVIKEGVTIWMREPNIEKGIEGIPIKKVRIITNSVKNPIEIKKHSTLSKSKHEHKQTVYGQNDENYAMAIYELDGKREFELINNFNLAKLLKQSQSYYPLHKGKEIKGKKILVPIEKRNNKDVILKRGQQVVFYDRTIENPKDISEIIDFRERIYIIEGLTIQRQKDKKTSKVNEYGIIQLRHFKEARKSEEISKDNFKPDGEFKINENKPTRKMNHNQFTAFVEGIDFKVLPSGKFQKI
ncbi:type II CRISPR RNA-guided endonuclease Cas9 [Flavobacterium columnare]|uniref:type II CRISPR RNA-guided endonuclease Cas9 n=1 Tax=Flavobacterium columnare TaxID=996 RepID=UPI002D1FE324|nr:type II CRISPR RNA-guided endonuclease Cas9 [Flavobacterium columnare]MEB3800308.1 type II CRISPR RNA-guided endonuclease Cas9 [Flavobacterium columnare]